MDILYYQKLSADMIY